jgi:hypothetical protein
MFALSWAVSICSLKAQLPVCYTCKYPCYEFSLYLHVALKKRELLLSFLIVSLFPNFPDCFFSSEAETESQLSPFPLAISVRISFLYFLAFLSVGRWDFFLRKGLVCGKVGWMTCGRFDLTVRNKLGWSWGEDWMNDYQPFISCLI